MAEEKGPHRIWEYQKERYIEKLNNTVLKIRGTLLLSTIVILFVGCGIYSFSGTSIPPEVETFSVQFFENKADIRAVGGGVMIRSRTGNVNTDNFITSW